MIQFLLIIPKFMFGIMRAFLGSIAEEFSVKKKNKVSIADIKALDIELYTQCCYMWKEINFSPPASKVEYLPFVDFSDSYLGKVRYLKVRRIEGEIEGVNLDVAGYVRALKGVCEQIVREKERLAALEAKRLSGLNEARELVNLPKKETGQLSLTENRHL